MELIFLIAVGLMVGTLALLALPLFGVAREAVRSHSVVIPSASARMSSTRAEREVEGAVRRRLYGDHRDAHPG
jgi:hypothetical protein